MRGGSGATAPASSGGAATAKGNIEKQIISYHFLAAIIDKKNPGSKYNYLYSFSGGKNSKDRKYVMTTDDLANAMADQGITVKKPPYFI